MSTYRNLTQADIEFIIKQELNLQEKEETNMTKPRCEECGCYDVDLEGFGVDDEGNAYTEYVCEECGDIIRVYEEE